MFHCFEEKTNHFKMSFILSFIQELNHSYIKQEMIQLHETLTVLEVKRDTMLAEEKTLVSPQEEREKLFKQVGFTVAEGNKQHYHSYTFNSKQNLSVLDRIKNFLVKMSRREKKQNIDL